MAICGICKNPHSVTEIRKCYAAKYGAVAVLDREEDTRTHSAVLPSPSVPQQTSSDVWSEVNNLRKQISEHLTGKPSGQRLGYFAINVADGLGGAPVKFYRVKRVQNGRTYIDAQGSDEYWPVRSPQSISMVLRAILGDPKKAAELYASSLGKCYRCGRTLTDETSRSIGMGPECRSK